MAKRIVTEDMRDPATPEEVIICAEGRKPQTDPTCGVRVTPVPVQGRAKHRLVTIGDSLTHGFQSGAILNTDISWPRIVAWEMGWDRPFRYPKYHDPNGGMPLNIEVLVRELERRHGAVIDWWEAPGAIVEVIGMLARLDKWWAENWKFGMEVNAGSPHNLAVWGWDLRDCLHWNARTLATYISEHDDHYWRNTNAKSAWRVLAPAQDGGKALTVFQAAAKLGRDGSIESSAGPGVETLVVMLGSNNALGTVVELGRPRWSQEDNANRPSYADIQAKKRFNVWRPSHFKKELESVVREVEKISAQHVIFGTVPHVTIAPIARGVGDSKSATGSRYFDYYSRPWVQASQFNPSEDKHITGVEARAIDSAIDQYNDAIEAVVRAARKRGRDWYLLDVAGLLDRLASRRYLDDAAAQPAWWDEVGGAYPLPPALAQLKPQPNSRFFKSSSAGLQEGGLFSLDGVHPTTIGYGFLAQEVIRVMQLAGVKFYWGDDQKDERQAPVEVDFDRLLLLDSLMKKPPASLSGNLGVIGWLDQRVDNLFGAFGAQLF